MTFIYPSKYAPNATSARNVNGNSNLASMPPAPRRRNVIPLRQARATPTLSRDAPLFPAPAPVRDMSYTADTRYRTTHNMHSVHAAHTSNPPDNSPPPPYFASPAPLRPVRVESLERTGSTGKTVPQQTEARRSSEKGKYAPANSKTAPAIADEGDEQPRPAVKRFLRGYLMRLVVGERVMRAAFSDSKKEDNSASQTRTGECPPSKQTSTEADKNTSIPRPNSHSTTPSVGGTNLQTSVEAPQFQTSTDAATNNTENSNTSSIYTTNAIHYLEDGQTGTIDLGNIVWATPCTLTAGLATMLRTNPPVGFSTVPLLSSLHERPPSQQELALLRALRGAPVEVSPPHARGGGGDLRRDWEEEEEGGGVSLHGWV